MISQRRAVQLGVLSATAVFVTCIGVLVFQGDREAAQGGKTSVVDSNTQQQQPMSLSSSAAPVARSDTAQR
jgi:hypothetical protein